jgi:predicted Rossmann-fold nucleotide-binding protein
VLTFSCEEVTMRAQNPSSRSDKPTEWRLLQLWQDVAMREQQIPPRNHFRVVVFGSARLGADTPEYHDAYCLAKKLAKRHIDIVTGGGPGIMEAANKGAVAAQKYGSRCRSYGYRIQLPFEEEPSPFLNWAWKHQNFHTRLHHFAWAGDAFLCYSGGCGTFAELALMLQLLQVKHLPEDPPLICVGPMWKRIMTVAFEEWVSAGTISPRDTERIVFVERGHQSMPLILSARKRFYARRKAVA